jgi:hypothetical protein
MRAEVSSATGFGDQKIVQEGYLRVKQVAEQIAMSEDWVRRFFGNLAGVRTIKSPAKRFKRPYRILLIPAAVVERELRKMSPEPPKGSRPQSVQLVRRFSCPQ